MLVFKKVSSDPRVLDVKKFGGSLSYCIIWFRRKIEVYLNKFKYFNWPSQLSLDLPFDSGIVRKINNLDIDIVHVHWVSFGFFTISELSKVSHPIVVTARDMFWMTGGCHYTHKCELFKKDCDKCPGASAVFHYRIATQFKTKKDFFAKSNVNLFSISSWLKKQMLSSGIFEDSRINDIPINVLSDDFMIQDKITGRLELKLETDRKILLFGSIKPFTDERKGWDLFSGVCSELIKKLNFDVVVFGNENPPPDSYGFEVKCLGKVDKIKLGQIYSSADLFISCAQQEGFGKTTIESLLCGTPVIGMNTGIMEDAISKGINGYVVEDRYQLIECIEKGLNQEWDKEKIRKQALECFASGSEAEVYAQNYQLLINR